MAEESPDTAAQLPSNTTAEQNLRSAGQRTINLLWERAQARIAYYVVGVSVAVSAYIAICGSENAKAGATQFLGNVAALVIGFYFSRTNHARIGDDPSTKSATKALDDR